MSVFDSSRGSIVEPNGHIPQSIRLFVGFRKIRICYFMSAAFFRRVINIYIYFAHKNIISILYQLNHLSFHR